MKRNLLYYLYPRRGSIWPWHIEKLIRYQEAWNGRRIVTIALDQWTEPVDKVLAALRPLSAETLQVANDPVLGETRHFVEKLALLASLDPKEATFYAHAKGVTHDGGLLEGARKWSNAMYVLGLEHVAAVERALTLYGAVGAFRHFLNHAGARWCYAGTFFWVKHSTLFSRKWTEIEPSRFGVEGYPGRHLRWGELGTFTPDNIGPDWLYSGKMSDADIERWKGNWGDAMHGTVMQFLRTRVRPEEIHGKDVIEVGSYNVNGSPREVVEPLKPKTYVGVDFEKGPCVDRVISATDIARVLGHAKFDVVISTEMLEHAADWKSAVNNMKAVGKPGGLFFITTRSPGFPYHGYPSDHWRFTEQDFRKIFADMEILDITGDPDPRQPGIFIKAKKPMNWAPIDLSTIQVGPAPLPSAPLPVIPPTQKERVVTVPGKPVLDLHGLYVHLRRQAYLVRNVGSDIKGTHVYLDRTEFKDPTHIIKTWVGVPAPPLTLEEHERRKKEREEVSKL